MTKEFDPAHAAANGYTLEDWDEVSDNPEWTAADMAKATPMSEILPDRHASIARKRGPARTTASARKSESIFGKYDASIQRVRASFVRANARTAL